MNCTTIEQSKKLLNLGLSEKTADMCWTNHCYGQIRSHMRSENMTVSEYKKLLESFHDLTSVDVFYPSWSLNALLNVMPIEFVLSREHIKGKVFYRTSYLFEESSEAGYFEGESYVEACFKTVCWLLENGYIKKTDN